MKTDTEYNVEALEAMIHQRLLEELSAGVTAYADP